MPKGIYERNEWIPYNKGKESERKLNRIASVKAGLSIECKVHGIHNMWRYHSQNNVQCKKCSAEWQRKRKIKYPLKICFKDAKQHAKKSNRLFNISEEYLQELLKEQGNKCALSDIEFNDEIFPSIDRIDSSHGYEIGNIQIVTIEINRMKSNLNNQKFIQLCENVAKKSGYKPKKISDTKRLRSDVSR